MTCGDFHDGSENEQEMCIKFCASFGDRSTETLTMIQQAFGDQILVSMAYPVQDGSHISCRWRTHRETHKLYNPWKCCTNSRTAPSGSTSDHSKHCWGGGNCLWDMQTGCDERIWHAPRRSQICAQDPDSWPEAAALSSETQKWLSSPTYRTPLIWHLVTFSYFQKWNWTWKRPVWYHWVNPVRIAVSTWHSDRKGLPGSFPKLEESVGPVSTKYFEADSGR
jgi:hypothetical protein